MQVGSDGDVLGIGNAETLEDFDNFTIGTNSDFVTLTDDLASLGTSLRRWRQLWAIDGPSILLMKEIKPISGI